MLVSGTVVTIVADGQRGLRDADIVTVTTALQRLAPVVDIAPDVLAEGEALDLRLPTLPPQPGMMQALRNQFQNLELPLDIFVQPLTPSRRKRLLVADMDATIVDGETLDDMAAVLGIADQIVPITERAMRGEVEFTTALAERMQLFAGAPFSIVEDIRQSLRLMPGAVTLVRTMAREGARCVLASGGFDVFTSHVAQLCGFHAHFGNVWETDEAGKATGRMAGEIVDKQRKKDILLAQASQNGVKPDETLAVGDGANDIPLLQTASVGVAYRAKPLVCAATPHHVTHSDLTALLYLQGYKKAEFAS